MGNNQVPNIKWPKERALALEYYEAAKRMMEKAKAVLEVLEGEAEIECGKCEKAHPISEQVYIQSHYYVSPYSCNGGDYWLPGMGEWDCPSCGWKNRWESLTEEEARSDEWKATWNRPDIVRLKGKFKRVLDCYCEWDRTCDACKKAG